MAQTFIHIAQVPLDFQGKHYEPGDRFLADAFEGPLLLMQQKSIVAPADEQRAHGAHLTTAAMAQPLTASIGEAVTLAAETPKRPRGRPRKLNDDGTPARTYRRRDLTAEDE